MKRLGAVEICVITYAVERRSPREDSQLGDTYSYILHDPPLIVLRSGQTRAAEMNYLMHEIRHGIWEHSGLREAWLNIEDAKQYEETAIRIETPHMIAAVASMKRWRTR